MKLFTPKYYVKDFEHISIDRLHKQGIKLLLCDIDNTLVSYDEDYPNQKVIDFIDAIQASGIIVALCSNAKKERATRFSKDLHVSKTYYLSCKPLPFQFKRAMKEHNLNPSEVALVGDQLLTDMLGGNMAGVYTILSSPIGTKDSLPTKINRRLEKIVYHYLERTNQLKRGEFDG